MSKMKTLEEIQNDLDTMYGEGKWKVLSYEGGSKPCSLLHKCGKDKTLKRGISLRKGTLQCECESKTEARMRAYEERTVKEEAFQKEIDSIYGEGKWKIVSFSGSSKPLTVKHHCGQDKTITRAITMRRGACTCECELARNSKEK